MYLSELKLWNFRKYGNKDHLNSISTETKPDLNVLIEEYNSGKTCLFCNESPQYLLCIAVSINRISEKYAREKLKPIGWEIITLTK